MLISEIKMTKDGRGRGLYAKQEISTGQLLLVSNAVAVAYEDNSAGMNVDHRGNINLPSTRRSCCRHSQCCQEIAEIAPAAL
jgi:predicted RecA/RadA family phage recombinase